MNPKDEYRNMCSMENSIPIFSRDWWMDAVCGPENWDVIIVKKDNQVIAAMPYYLNKEKKSIRITQPLLTQTNGIWIKYPPGQKYFKMLSYQKDIMEEIIDRLESLKVDSFSQNFHYSISNWLPFYWRGYSERANYTYVLEYLSDLEAVYSNFQSNIRTDIKKAEKILQIKEDLQIEDFYKINTKTFERQGECIRYSLDFLKVLDEACLKNNCRKIFYAIDDENNIHAAIYIIWDENSAYYLMSGSDPVLRHSGANSLLLWHAIQFASRVTKKFDFEGSMIENIERFFRAFGTNQKQYFNISKDFKKSNVYKVIIKDIYSSSPVIKKLYSKLRRGRK